MSKKCIAFSFCEAMCNDTDEISEQRWGTLKKHLEKWKGLDKFGELYDSVDWDAGPIGNYIHSTCSLKISSSRFLEMAQKRLEKRNLEAAEGNEEPQQDEDDVTSPPPAKRTRSSHPGPLYDKFHCVWCGGEEDTKHPHSRKGKLLRVCQRSAWNNFKRHPVFLQNENDRERMNSVVYAISGLSDPFASDIRYHKKCWTDNICNVDKSGNHIQSVSLTEARSLFYKHVDNVIFENHEIRTLQSMLADYKNIVSDYGYDVGDMKSSYLKELLINEYGIEIGFKERQAKNQSEWVYDAKGGGDYIECAVNSLGISTAQLIQNLAPRITENMRSTPTVPWPPTLEDLEEPEELGPLILLLLTYLRNPKSKSIDISPDTLNLASLLTSYVTGKRTSTSIQIAIAAHGITRSRKLADILHKSVHAISYDDILLLYDYWALRDLEASKTCPQALAEGVPGICIVDNDDFDFDSLTGEASKAHRTNVMFVQPEDYEKKNENILAPAKKKDLTRQLNQKCADLTDVKQYKCPRGASKEPPQRAAAAAPVDGTRPQRIRSVIHALARSDNNGVRPSPADQKVPAYMGFQSCLSEELKKSKPYFHASYPEPPSKSVIYDVMVKLVAAMKEKKIPHFYLVGDLPTYKDILFLKNENPDMFKDIIPIVGQFHEHMSYMYAVYKRFEGSGLADVLVSAGVLAGGSAVKALRGKHYRKGLRSINEYRETSIHVRLKEILPAVQLPQHVKDALEVLRDPLNESQVRLSEAYHVLELSPVILDIVSQVYTALDTDMSRYWLSFLEMTDPLIQNITACHSQRIDEFKTSNYDMLKGLLAYNNSDYARYMGDFWAMVEEMPDEQYDFFKDHFVQSLTGRPYSAMPLDMWIEVTMNLGSKVKAAWIGLLQNDKQLFVNLRNANNIARVQRILEENLQKKTRNVKHTECQPARMIADEKAVVDIMETLEECGGHMFNPEYPDLRSLQSGIIASDEAVLDFSVALHEGQMQVEDLLEKRVFHKEVPLTARIPKNKRITFKNMSVEKQTSASLSHAQMEQAGLASIISLAESTGFVTLDQILENRVTEECLSMYYVNGSKRMTTKSKLLEKLNMSNVIPELPGDYSSIVDMGMIWRLATPTPEDRESARRDGRQYLWLDYLDKVVNLAYCRHPRAISILLMNDIYGSPSIKDEEHERRSRKPLAASKKFPKPSDEFLSPTEVGAFLSDSQCKNHLQKLVKEHATLKRNPNQGVLYCVGPACTDLKTQNQVPRFALNHAEADTMMCTAYSLIRETFPNLDIVMDTADTDNYVQAAFISHQLQGNLFIKHKDGYINSYDLLDDDTSEVVIPAHIFGGGDHTNSFYGKGKKKYMDRIINDEEARELLSDVGSDPDLDNDVKYDMEQFLLTKIYGCSPGLSCGEARAEKWRKQKKKNTLNLPPDSDSLHHDLQRVNYLTYIMKNFHLKEHPTPIGRGWELVNGSIRAVRYSKPALPNLATQRPTTAVQPQLDTVNEDSETDIETDADTDTDCESEFDSSDEE